MPANRKKSIFCALSLLLGLATSAPAFAIGWGYNQSYYGGYGRNYYWWPGTWWVPASYAQVLLGFPYRYFTQQTPMPASAYPALSLHRTNYRYYDSYNTAGTPPYQNMTPYQYQQWLLQNGYAVPPNALPPAGYLSTPPAPRQVQGAPGSQFVYNTYGPNTQLPYGPDSERVITTEPGYFEPNGKPKKPKHFKHQEEQVAQGEQPNNLAYVPWHYSQPTTPPPVQPMAGAYYANERANDPESFVRTLNTKYGGNMSAALFDPETRQLAHQVGLIDSDDLFDVDLGGDKLTQMKGILQSPAMASPAKIQALKQMLTPTSVAAGGGMVPM